MDQTGDPTGTGEGGPGYQFADELPKKASPQYPLGSVAMANSGPNTNGSQFFIVAGSQGESLAPSYSLFGQVTSGMDVIDKINADGEPAAAPAHGDPPHGLGHHHRVLELRSARPHPPLPHRPTEPQRSTPMAPDMPGRRRLQPQDPALRRHRRPWSSTRPSATRPRW